MIATNTYLHFDGDCREAMNFYGQCLGAEPNFTPYSAGPSDLIAAAPDAAERILHAEFTSGPVVLMASDVLPEMPFQRGNNFSISIACESEEELTRLFQAFGDGGQVKIALHDAFWGGRFGMLTDRFGIHWLFTYRAAAPQP